jgi:RNA ligase (TIGR02306 family)
MPERTMATVEPIVSVTPIPGADSIEAATVRGWTVVVRKGEFAAGDLCVYIELDAFLPVDDPRFSFLAARGVKHWDDRAGHVLRTAKLRGIYSQGLAIAVDQFPELVDPAALSGTGVDIADVLGIVKYEPPLPADLAGRALGLFPTRFAPRTDAERVQNLVDRFEELRTAATWMATEKVDGTSVTYIRDGGVLRVCSRNLELAPADGTQWRIAEQLGIFDLLDDGDACQGELYGDGIQGNPLKVRGHHFAMFALWRNRRPLPRALWPSALAAHAAPVYDLMLPATVADAVEQADGIESLIAPGRLAEGIVWHSATGDTFAELEGRGCFKVISNRWLLKHAST